METQFDGAERYEASRDLDGAVQRRSFREAIELPVAELRIRDVAARWLQRRGVHTVRDLVTLAPTDMRRRMDSARYSTTRRAVSELLGCEWEVARARVLAPPSKAAPKKPRIPVVQLRLQWEVLRATVDDAARALALGVVPGLPTRMIHYVAREKIGTVGALLALPYDTLHRARNVARITLQNTVVAMRAWAPVAHRRPLAVPSAPPPPCWEELGLVALLDAMVARMSHRQRAVVELRVGSDAEKAIHTNIAQQLGVTESRVSQILREAARAMATEREGAALLAARLRAVLDGGALTFEAIAARDPWLAALDGRWPLVSVLVAALPDCEAHLVRIDDVPHVAPFTATRYSDALRDAHRAFTALPAPVEDAQVEALVALHARGMGEAVERVFRARLGARWRPLVYGPLTRTEIKALLRASPTPLRVDTFDSGRGGVRWPFDVVMLSGGRVTLSERFEGFDAFALAAAPRCAAWIAARGPDQRWRSADLLAALEDLELPAWFEPEMLASIGTRTGLLRGDREGFITRVTDRPQKVMRRTPSR